MKLINSNVKWKKIVKYINSRISELEFIGFPDPNLPKEIKK